MDDVSSLLGTWRPVPPGLARLQAGYSAAINVAVAERCRAPADGALSERAERMLPRVRESRWTTPTLAFAHFVGHAEAGLAAVADDLEAVSRRSEPPEAQLDAHRRGLRWVAYAMSAFEVGRRGKGAAASPFLVSDIAHDRRRVPEALALLRDTWPDMASAVERFVREVVWFSNSEWRRSGSLVQAYGAIFISEGRGLASTLEAIVHEATHLELTARLAVDGLMENGRELELFGPRPRRLTAVLHAALVCQRVLHALSRCDGRLSVAERESASALASESADRLAVAITSLERHARWTARGRELFTSMERDRRDLGAVAG